MKLGVFTAILDHQPLETALDYLQGLGVQAVELGCGGTAGHSHANPEILLNDAGALREFQRTIDRHHMEISALSCHGNPVHPNPETARAYDKPYGTRSCWPSGWGSAESTPFPAAPAAILTPTIPTGSPVPGRRIFRRFWTTNGTRSSFPIGGKRRPSPLSTALLKSLWKCIRASASTIQSRSCACAAPWESRSAPIWIPAI